MKQFSKNLIEWVIVTTKEKYLPLFIIFFTVLIFQLFNLSWCKQAWLDSDGLDGKIMATIGLLLPLAGTIIIGYKGLYQYWMDYKQGKSR